MERSADWTRIIKRSKGAGSIALVVTLVCAIFGVGGAAAGDGSYARHVREARLHARLAGAALAHRSPAQLLLAVTPKTPAAPAPAPAATTTTPATTATTPAATVTTTAATQVAPASTTPANTSSDATPGSATSTDNDGGTANLPTGTGNTLTDTTTGTTTTGTTTTGTTTTGTTTTGTTTTGTTTTGTTTTGTTTTGTTTTNPPSNATGTSGTSTGTTGNGFTGSGSNAATGANHLPGSSGSGSTTPECHGRCSGLGQGTTSGVVPTSTPSSTTSTAATTGFTLGVTPITSTPTTATTPITVTTPINAVSTSGSLNPTPTSTSTSTSSTSGSSSTAALIPLTNLPTFTSSSALRKITKATTQGGHGTLLASAGTGGTGAATLGGGPTAPTAGTAAGTTGRTSGTAGRASARPKTSAKPKHQTTGGSTPFTPAVRVIDQVVKVIPTALWIALGAAFGLALVCAAVALRSSRRARRREREFTAISAAAQTDPLTGILNRRGFMDAAERELARASRYNRPFVLAYVDVRGLKAVNDTEGHLMGDELIKAVAGLMKESARADDVVGRIGGDEFALLLGEQTAESAEPVVRRIRARVAERRAAMEIGMPWELTIGLAAFPQDGTTLEELLGTADRRLYEQRGIALR
jgi:diguanylate cyclase (GGDEF)-like protein